MTRGGPGDATQVFFYEAYLEAFRYFRIGFACAMITMLLLLVAAVNLVQIWLRDRRSHLR
jgi:ABC-type sugar transport system permease subunit